MKRLWLIYLTLMLVSVAAMGSENKILELKDKIVEVQNKGILGYQEYVLCLKIFGFGSYVPNKEAKVDKNGELLIYFEPQNLFTNKRDGLYEVWYTQDMALLNEEGEVLQEWKDFLTFQYTSKKPVMDMFGQNSLNLGGALAPGKYQVRSVLHDKLRGSSATHIMKFQVQ